MFANLPKAYKNVKIKSVQKCQDYKFM